MVRACSRPRLRLVVSSGGLADAGRDGPGAPPTCPRPRPSGGGGGTPSDSTRRPVQEAAEVGSRTPGRRHTLLIAGSGRQAQATP